MSILTAQIVSPKTTHFSNEQFSLSIVQNTLQTQITMYLYTPTINTESIKETVPILEKSLSCILASTCFNDANLPFSKEVTQTELGHLFEHMLLEYLCNLKLKQGHKNPVHNGITQWDWTKDERGTFHILVDSGKKDTEIFFNALSLSISLLEEILQYDPIKKRKDILREPFAYQLQ